MNRSTTAMSDRIPARGRTPAPTNSYLQERLAESRTQSSRSLSSSRPSVQPGRDDYIFDDDRPPTRAFMGSSPPSHARRPSDGLRSGLGVRESERRIDKLSKENFNLKLELHYRDETLTKLQQKMHQMTEKIERATMLEAANKELLDLQEELFKELEKRGEAVKEAVEMINNLEDQLQSQSFSLSRPSTSQADTGYGSAASNPPGSRSRSPSFESKPIAENLSSQPPQSQSPLARSQPTPKPTVPAQGHQPIHAAPSLSDKKTASHALRQLYLSGEKSLRTIRDRSSMISVISSKFPDSDSALPPSPPSPALSDVSELDSTFFGQHSEGSRRYAPPHEDLGTSLFTKATPRPYTRQQRSPSGPAIGVSRSLEDSILRGSGSVPASPHRSPRLHDSGRSPVQDDPSDLSYAPMHSSPLRSPKVSSSRRPHQRTYSGSISPRSPSPPTLAVRTPDHVSTSPSVPPYGGFPTGDSITHGTPSRFARPVPAAANLLFDGEGIEDFQSLSPSLHHPTSISVSSSQRKRSVSSGVATGPKVSPPLVRNYTMSSMPNSHHEIHIPNLHTRRFPPHNRTPHPLSQNSEYVPYRPASRDEPRPHTPSNQFPSLTSPVTSHSSTGTPSIPPTRDSDSGPLPQGTPRHNPPQPHSRKASFTPIKSVRAVISSLNSGSSGSGGVGGDGEVAAAADETMMGSGGDRGRSSRTSAFSYEIEGPEGPESALERSGHRSLQQQQQQLQQQLETSTPPRSESRMGSLMGKGRSPSQDGSGRKRWPWKRGKDG